MQSFHPRGRLFGGLVTALSLVTVIGTSAPNLDACPVNAPQRRGPGAPVDRIWDHRITDSPGEDPSGGANASLALSANGRIAVAYERPAPDNPNGNALSLQRFNVNVVLSGSNPPECICDIGDDCPLRLDDAPTNGTLFSHVSLAIAREGEHDDCEIFAAWLSQPPAQTPSRVLLPNAYEFRDPSLTFSRADLGPAPASSGGNDDFGPSAAIQPARESVGLTSRLRVPASDRRGLIQESQVLGSVGEDRIRCCDDGASCPDAPLETCAVQVQQWQPSVRARRTDGITCIVWAEREIPNSAVSAFNIALRVYDSSGVLVGDFSREGPLYRSVNQPSLELPESNQGSPAVDIDECGNIIVVWVGPALQDTTICGHSPGGLSVYGRRLAFQNGTLYFRDNQFVVNNDTRWRVGPDPDLVNPDVALHKTPDGGFAGQFFIAWNAVRTFIEQPEPPFEFDQWGVRGRFFKAGGRFRTNEFDVTPNEPDSKNRTLAESAQHTIAYWSKDTALASWTENDQATSVEHVWYSVFEFAFIDAISLPLFCVEGDADGDTDADTDDILPFVNYLLTEQVICSVHNYIRCAVDTNNDGETDGLDIQCFTNILTSGSATDACNIEPITDCGVGGGESMMAGGGDDNGIDAPENGGAADGDWVQPESPPSPLDDLSDEEIEARWNTLTDFVVDHPREDYPAMTDAEFEAALDDSYFSIMYDDVVPVW